MADLTGLTNDQLAEHVRDGLTEAETRLEANGLTRALRRVQNAHAVLSDVGNGLASAGQVSTDSVGGDKP